MADGTVTFTGDTSVRCLVVGASNSVEFATTDADGESTVLAASLTDSTVVSVDVYVFYDGNASNINTNNIRITEKIALIYIHYHV